MNTFGTSQIQVKLVDPRDARRYRKRFRRDLIPQLEFANSLYCPGGRWPTRGWILLTRSDYDRVRGYGTAYTLNFADVMTGTNLTFQNLAIVQARCVTTGLANDPAAVYLVELTDYRGILWNEWFQFTTDAYYNVLSPAYPDDHYSDSLNAGLPFSWSAMIDDMWQAMALGTFPGLPSVPASIPTNWNLPGVHSWPRICDMLYHVGMSVSVDPTSLTPYGIVENGDDDANFDALTAKYLRENKLEDDLEWIDIGSGRVPGSVVVWFRRVNQFYGTEETIRRDSGQWATNSVYPITIPAPVTFTGAVGVHGMFDDYPIRFDVNNVPIAADVAAATIIASERVQQYFDDIISRTSGYMNRTYTGVLPFFPGSQIDGVVWRQDFREQEREGFRTQVLRGPLWPEVYPNASKH